MIVRIAELEDVSSILMLDKFFNLNFSQNEKEVEDQIKLSNYYVIEKDAEIMGAISMLDLGEEIFIDSLLIDPRLIDTTIDQKLISFVKGYALKNNKKYLSMASLCRAEIIELYKKWGFRELKTTKLHRGKEAKLFFMDLTEKSNEFKVSS
jgi:N-acetylglutamate synthase-like GNAT family acetyltransferase